MCLGEEISPRPLQQKVQVSKGMWVQMSVLSSWRTSPEVRMDKSWRSCMETVSGLTCRRSHVLAGVVVPGSTGCPLPCRHVAEGCTFFFTGLF